MSTEDDEIQALIDAVTANPLHEVWCAAVDAVSSADFRDEAGDLNELMYLRKCRRVQDDVLAKVRREMGDHDEKRS